jgi:hypothetical protein
MTAQLAERLTELNEDITAAKLRIAAGQLIDISSIEDEVVRLCTSAAELPQHEGRTLRAAMVVLLAEVDSLQQELVKALSEITGELARLGRQKQANSAYGRRFAPSPISGRQD